MRENIAMLITKDELSKRIEELGAEITDRKSVV